MSRALLDVNVLLALLYRDHVHHDRARDWLASQNDASWASCAVTQNGFIRISSQRKFPHAVTVSSAADTLRHACAARWHEFWSCDYSILSAGADSTAVLRSKSVTDAYLLGLAVSREGRLVTFDRFVPLAAVDGATAAHLVVL